MATIKAGVYVVLLLRSNVMPKLPLVTPRGNPIKLGVWAATPALPTPGMAVQQWMCAAELVPIKPANVIPTVSVLAPVLTATRKVPAAVELLGGVSNAPLRAPLQLIGVAPVPALLVVVEGWLGTVVFTVADDKVEEVVRTGGTRHVYA